MAKSMLTARGAVEHYTKTSSKMPRRIRDKTRDVQWEWIADKDVAFSRQVAYILVAESS